MSSSVGSDTVQVNGVQLAYSERGEGQPVIFVHGGFSDLRAWAHQLDEFSRNYRAISYSMRYHYPNPWKGDGTDYNVAVHASDLAELIEELNASKAHIVGASYGARTALHLARDHPELVRSLTLGEPSLSAWLQGTNEGPALLEDMTKNYFGPGENAIRKGDIEGGTRLMVDGVGGKGTFEKTPVEIRQNWFDNIRVQTIQAAPVAFTRDDANKINSPVLLLTGELSPRAFVLMAEELEKSLQQCTRVIIPAATHMLHYQNPEAYNRTVLAFLASH